MSEHTKEAGFPVISVNNELIGVMYSLECAQRTADLHNACSDIPNPEGIPKLVEACRAVVAEARRKGEVTGNRHDPEPEEVLCHEALKEAGIG